MSSALITGITGQDGSYLAELLLTKGYRVAGIVRDKKRAMFSLPSTLADEVNLFQWDFADERKIRDILSEQRPREMYNFAAYSSGEGMFHEPVAIGEINGILVARILEAIREVDPGIRFCQASSSEMFGETPNSPQTERTPFHPRSPYGAAKLYAHWMINIYRRNYDLFACSAILFNHESPRRGPGFVTRKVARAAASIKRGAETRLRLGNLDARRDWGFSGDYVRAMWLMLQQSSADDYVIATGETHSVRELCEQAFACVGLDYRQYVETDESCYRPTEFTQLVGDSGKARSLLHWEPHVSFPALVRMMVESELELLGEHGNP